MFEAIHLFLLVPNDSGSTWLQNNISLCSNCVSFSPGLDGKGVCDGTTAYPNQEINKLFSENIPLWESPGEYDWEAIKKRWYQAWSESGHNPQVYLEKTPQAIYASDMYVEQFDNVRFIIMVRNPHAVAEGMRRTILGEVDIGRCARHWIECAKRQMYNMKKYREISVTMRYEDLIEYPEVTAERIRSCIPALHDIDFSKEAAAHSLEGMKSKPLTDFNEQQIKNLSAEDITIINQELEQVPEVLEYFGYKIIGV